jgi:hypothetical protein
MTDPIDATSADHTSTKTDPNSTTEQPKRSRTKRNLLIALPLIALLAGLGWLFSAEGTAPAAPENLADLPRVDGTLNVVEADRLVMTLFEPLDGQSEVEFIVPEKYAGNFDLAHMRSHSSVGIPTRIYYLDQKQDGAYVAVYKADAPANSSNTK